MIHCRFSTKLAQKLYYIPQGRKRERLEGHHEGRKIRIITARKGIVGGG